VGSPEEATEKPLRGVEYPLGGFFIPQYFLLSAIYFSFQNALFLKIHLDKSVGMGFIYRQFSKT